MGDAPDSSPRAVRFTAVQIERLDGLGEPFALDDLVPGVNVIHAPNGVGKSRTAHAMNLLLWPAMPRPEGDRRNERLAAEMMVGPDRRRVSLDAGAARWTDANGPVAAPNLPPAEHRDRYDFSLAALQQTDGAGFARLLRAESDGGYDLERAAKELGLKPGVSARLKQTSEYLNYESAKRAHADAVAAAERLRGEEGRLSQLAADLRAATDAGESVKRIERQLEVVTARSDVAAGERALAEFPPAMARLTGREADNLAAMRARRATAEQERRDALARAALSNRDVEQAAVPDEFDGPRVAAISKRVEGLKERRRDADAASAEAARAAARWAATAGELGAEADADVAVIDAAAVREVEAFARRAEAARAAFDAADVAAAELAGEASEYPVPPERLGDGARSLRAWLREPATAESGAAERDDLRRWLLVAAGVVFVLTLLLAWLVSVMFGLIVLLAGWLAFVAVRRPDEVALADARPVLAEQYWRLNLPAPAAWDVAAVEALCDQIEQQHAAAVEASRRGERRRAMEQKRERARPAVEQVERERRGLTERFGAAPASGPAALLLWARSLLAHREARAASDAASAGAVAARVAFDEALAALADELRPLAGELPDLPAVAAAAEELAARRADADRSTDTVERAREAVASADKSLAALDADAAAVFASVGLNESDEAELADLLGRLPDRAKAASELYAARDRLGRAESAAGQEIADLDADALRRERDRLRTIAVGADNVRTEIAQINERVRAATRGHGLADALAARDAAADALRAARDRDRAAVAGWALVERLRRARDRDHRPVFARAQALFAEITRGRYSLGVSESAGETFLIATDTAAGEVRPLGQLSGGTKVQLLLAVRLAFVERQEAGVAAPLFMDETLATTDDARAREVIAAAAASVRAGRQVFYFTAQQDEVRKWRESFDVEPDVPLKVIDLASARKLGPAAAPFAPADLPAPPDVPDPAGMRRAEYGRRLDVPAVDPSRGVGAVHVFHLVHRDEDLPALRKLLADGIETWGQWRTVAEHGRAGEAFARAEVVAAVLEEILRFRSVGRGKAVDRHALVESGAVSETYIEAAVNLAAEKGGDAAAILASLDAGALPRFRKANIDQLCAHFTEAGYLADEPPLSREEVRLKTLGAMDARLNAAGLDARVIDSCLAASGESGG